MNISIRRIGSIGILGVFLMGWSGITNADWANPDLLITPEALKKNLDKSDWVVVDCRDLKDYAKGHIQGAISLGKRCKTVLRDPTSRVYRDTSKYENLFGKVGIGNDTHVVFYYGDMSTLTDATVGFWLMEYLGHDKVHLLNGGLEAWRKAGNRLDQKPSKRDPTTFKANVEPKRYTTTAELLEIAKGQTKDVQVIDSRTNDEFEGKDIRAVRGGHVPHTSVNISHLDTLLKTKDPKSGKMVPVAYFDEAATQKAFESLDKNKRTVAYCQTGTRSTMTYLQMRLMGFKDPANWDESWTVYGSQLAYPVDDEQWFNFAGVNKNMKKMEARLEALENAAKSGKK